MKRQPRRCWTALVLGVLLAALTAATAQAGATIDVSKQVARIQAQVDALMKTGRTAKPGVLTTSAVCGRGTLASVFAPWRDGSQYVLAPAGSFEGTTGWTWDPGSRVVADNNAFSAGSAALMLGSTGMAASSAMCVTTRYSTIRFFARNTGVPESLLTVSVLYQGVDGKIHQLRIATLAATSTWAPTVAISYRINRAAASPGGVTAVAFLFTSSGGKSRGTAARELQMSGHKGQGDHGDDKADEPAKDDGHDHDHAKDGDAGKDSPTGEAGKGEAGKDKAGDPPAGDPGTGSGVQKSTADGGWVIDDLDVGPFNVISA
jgi:hypothetical protein